MKELAIVVMALTTLVVWIFGIAVSWVHHVVTQLRCEDWFKVRLICSEMKWCQEHCYPLPLKDIEKWKAILPIVQTQSSVHANTNVSELMCQQKVSIPIVDFMNLNY